MERALRWLTAAAASLLVFLTIFAGLDIYTQLDDGQALTWAGLVLALVGPPLAWWASLPLRSARSPTKQPIDAIPATSGGQLPIVDDVVSLIFDGNRADRLGLQNAIPLPDQAAADLSPFLPTYVVRDIDGNLRAFLGRAAKTGGFVLVIGPATAGKTRTAFEAISGAIVKTCG